MILTQKIKLHNEDSLKRTMKEFNRACNFLSELCFDARTFRQYDIHKEFYYKIRKEFNLPAQMVIRVIAKVCDSYKIDTKIKRRFRPLGAIIYDARLLSWKEGIISISTVEGRKKLKYSSHIKIENPKESKLILDKGRYFILVSMEVPEEKEIEVKGFLGCDLGIKNILVDSENEFFSSAHVNNLRKRHVRLRKKLQSKGTRGAKRLLKHRNKKEHRFAENINHTISKRIVVKAQRHSFGIGLEDLTNISKRVTVRRGQRYQLKSWSFASLGSKIAYKGKRFGVPIVFVDPKYTSQECFVCGHIEKTNRDRSKFKCKSCGHTAHADYNASRVIARRATVDWPHLRKDILALDQNCSLKASPFRER